MRRHNLLLILVILTVSAGAQQKNPLVLTKSHAAGYTVVAPIPTLSNNEAFNFASKAHEVAVDIFYSAFAAEVDNRQKAPWSEVRPTLLEYWSEQVVDNNFKEFYADHLWDWGYEMGFAFPLWRQEFILDSRFVSREDHKITVEFLVHADYNTNAIITVELILQNNRFVVSSLHEQ